jgi:hypothetical protein
LKELTTDKSNYEDEDNEDDIRYEEEEDHAEPEAAEHGAVELLVNIEQDEIEETNVELVKI